MGDEVKYGERNERRWEGPVRVKDGMRLKSSNVVRDVVVDPYLPCDC